MNGGKMKNFLISSLAISFLVLGIGYPAFTANSPPSTGGVLPIINLTIPKILSEKQYLGLAGEGIFKIPQIKAEVVIIEIFSMYCPNCQKDAPKVNELYTMIENQPELKTKIKLIGIGAGNTSYEVELFKKTYSIPFPLFPDKDFFIHKACGEVRTPYYIIVKNKADGSHQIVHAQLGGFEEAEPFLKLVLSASGLR
jgi:thiol-disulfide isomerase/thioredoxin